MSHTPILTVDAILFTLVTNSDVANPLADPHPTLPLDTDAPLRLAVWLHQRDHAPFENSLALPGGYIHTDRDATAREAITRILASKVGLPVSQGPLYLEQFRSVSGMSRDPRGWSLSDVWMTVCSPTTAAFIKQLSQGSAQPYIKHSTEHRPHPGQWIPLEQLYRHPIAFDHKSIIEEAAQRLRAVSTYSSLPLFFFGETPFSITEAHRITQQILGRAVDPLTFRKKFEQNFADVLTPAGSRSLGGRPSKLFTLNPANGFCRFPSTKPL